VPRFLKKTLSFTYEINKDMGIHFITVVFEGEEISEQEIAVYVYNKELLEAERKEKADAD